MNKMTNIREIQARKISAIEYEQKSSSEDFQQSPLKMKSTNGSENHLENNSFIINPSPKSLDSSTGRSNRSVNSQKSVTVRKDNVLERESGVQIIKNLDKNRQKNSQAVTKRNWALASEAAAATAAAAAIPISSSRRSNGSACTSHNTTPSSQNSGPFVYLRSLFTRRSFQNDSTSNRKNSNQNNEEVRHRPVRRNPSAPMIRPHYSKDDVTLRNGGMYTYCSSSCSSMGDLTRCEHNDTKDIDILKSTVTHGLLSTAGFVWVPMMCSPSRRSASEEEVDARLEEVKLHERWLTRRDAIFGHIEQPLPQETRERLEREVAERKSSIKRKVSQYFKALYCDDYEVDLN